MGYGTSFLIVEFEDGDIVKLSLMERLLSGDYNHKASPHIRSVERIRNG